MDNFITLNCKIEILEEEKLYFEISLINNYNTMLSLYYTYRIILVYIIGFYNK